MTAVAVAAQQDVAEQIRFPNVAMEDTSVWVRAPDSAASAAASSDLPHPGGPFQVGVLLRKQGQGQPRRGVVLANQHPAERRPQFDEGGGQFHVFRRSGPDWSHGGGMLAVASARGGAGGEGPGDRSHPVR